MVFGGLCFVGFFFSLSLEGTVVKKVNWSGHFISF